MPTSQVISTAMNGSTWHTITLTHHILRVYPSFHQYNRPCDHRDHSNCPSFNDRQRFHSAAEAIIEYKISIAVPSDCIRVSSCALSPSCSLSFSSRWVCWLRQLLVPSTRGRVFAKRIATAPPLRASLPIVCSMLLLQTLSLLRMVINRHQEMHGG